MAERSEGRSEHRTEERPPYIRLEFPSTGAYCGTDAVRESLLREQPGSLNRDAKYRYTVARWDSANQLFPPVRFGRSSTNNFLMGDDQVSREQASFQLKLGHGRKLEIHLKNLGNRELHHFRGNIAKTLGPNSDSIVLANGDVIGFHTVNKPLRMKCDLNTEPTTDPLTTGFTVAVEEITRSISSGHQDDVPEITPMQPRD